MKYHNFTIFIYYIYLLYLIKTHVYLPSIVYRLRNDCFINCLQFNLLQRKIITCFTFLYQYFTYDIFICKEILYIKML